MAYNKDLSKQSNDGDRYTRKKNNEREKTKKNKPKIPTISHNPVPLLPISSPLQLL